MDLGNTLQSFAVLQRNKSGVSEHPFSGICSGSGEVLMTVKNADGILPGFNKVAVGSAARRRMSGVVAGLPVGGPYTVALQIAGTAEKAVYKDILVGDLWLLTGQSNMADYGFLPSCSKPDPMVHAFYMTNEWNIAKDPLHDTGRAVAPVHGGNPACSPKSAGGRGSGPGLAFALDMYKKTGIPQGLIACAHGGTSLDQWDPARKKLGGNSLYGAMYERLRDLGGKVAGALWYQGCNETANMEKVLLYTKRTSSLFAAMRRDCGDPELPIVMVQLGPVVICDGDTTAASQRWLLVRNQQYLLPRKVKNLVCVPAIDLPLSDHIHLSNRGVAVLGKRMADAMQYLREPGMHPAQIKVKKLSVTRNFVNGNAMAEIEFDNVCGELQTSGGEPCGFGLIDKEGKYVADAISCELKGNRAIAQLKVSSMFFNTNYQLAYGGSFQPHANIVDSAGRSLPCFIIGGRKNPANMTGFVSEAMVAGPFYGDDGLETLGMPSDAELAEMKFGKSPFSQLYVLCPPAEAGTDKNTPRKYYFRFQLDLPEDMELKMLFGADAPFALYCDQKELLREFTSNPVVLDEFKKVFKLDAGRHEFFCAFSSNSGRGWGFCCRFIRQNGKNAPGLVNCDQFK